VYGRQRYAQIYRQCKAKSIILSAFIKPSFAVTCDIFIVRIARVMQLAVPWQRPNRKKRKWLPALVNPKYSEYHISVKIEK
jgi:hypothetical protein